MAELLAGDVLAVGKLVQVVLDLEAVLLEQPSLPAYELRSGARFVRRRVALSAVLQGRGRLSAPLDLSIVLVL